MTAAAQPGPAADAAFSPEAFRAHVAYLADDRLEGRDTGSRSHEIAARYVADQFAALGLRPAEQYVPCSWPWFRSVFVTPSAALRRLERGDPFDVAVLDMHMPEMDGLALAGEIRASARRSRSCSPRRWPGCRRRRTAGSSPSS